MNSPEERMRIREGVRGRVTNVSTRHTTAFVEGDTTGRIYGCTDRETVAKLAPLLTNTSPLYVTFTSMRQGNCSLMSDVVVEEPIAPSASNFYEHTQPVERMPPIAENQVTKTFPSAMKASLPNTQNPLPTNVPSAPTTRTLAIPVTKNPFGVPAYKRNAFRPPSGIGGIQPNTHVPTNAPLQPAPDRVPQAAAPVPQPSQADPSVPLYVGIVKDPFISAVKFRPVPPTSVNRYNACFNTVCADPPLASSDREFSTPPPQVHKPIAPSAPRISMKAGDNYELHDLLNRWYRNPAYFNRDDYPFPCGGFVVPQSNNIIMVFTRRLGIVTRKEDPARNGRPYAYFMVCGPNNYQAWEYDEYQPPAFKSTKYVSSTEVEMKGYALMAPGNRNDPESAWVAWNDHTGFMRCQTSCARILKKKYVTWEPTAQMVMFDAIYDGDCWSIKTLSYIDYQFTNAQGVWPKQAYFVDDLRVLPIEQQRNPKEEIRMYSETIGDVVIAPLQHIRFLPQGKLQFETIYGGVVITLWGNQGLGRRLQCLMAAPECMWKDRKLANYVELSQTLMIREWNTEINLETPQPTNPAYHRMQNIENGVQAVDPNHCFPTLEGHYKPHGV